MLKMGHLHCASGSKPLFPGNIWSIVQGRSGWVTMNNCYSRSTSLVPGIICHISCWELWQLPGAVAARVPLLWLGLWPASGHWVLSVPVFLPGWGLALPVHALFPGWRLGGLPVQVIFPSFLCTNLLNLLICPSPIFKYLNSLTFSINSLHCSSWVAVTYICPFVYYCYLGDYWWIYPWA